MMIKFICAVLFPVLSVHAAITLDTRLWLYSQAAVAATSTADIVSTLQSDRRERNPLLPTPQHIILTKTATVSGNLIVQWWLIRRYPSWARRLAGVNFGLAGGLGVVAGWNWRGGR